MSASAISTSKDPGILQGWILVATAWLSVMANMVVSPILPAMAEHFSSVNHVELLMSWVPTIPAFFVAILAIPAGIFADHIGRKKLLFTAVLFYGIVGTAPIWLTGLSQIVVSRALVGITEAAIMTVGTAMIGDYYSGKRRERFLAAQTGTAPIIATVVTVIGGIMGASGWRNPYFIYAFGFVLIPLVGFFLKEPPRATAEHASAASGSAKKISQSVTLSGFFHEWGKLIWICLITVFGMTAFMVTIIQFSYLLGERGIESAAQRGLYISITTLANPIGALIFTKLPWKTLPKLTLSFLLFSVGFLIMGLSSTWVLATVGAMIANLGAGMILPTLVTWALATLAPEKRGEGTGAWQASSFLGQFLSTQFILGLKMMTGSISNAVVVYGVTCGVFGIISLFSALKYRNRADGSEALGTVHIH